MKKPRDEARLLHGACAPLGFPGFPLPVSLGVSVFTLHAVPAAVFDPALPPLVGAVIFFRIPTP